MKPILALLVVAVGVHSWDPKCITKPVGFGYNTTGGAGGRVVTPKNIEELITYLRSKETLVIDLDKTFDFTNSEGWASSAGCYYKKCRSGYQTSLAKLGTCNGRISTSVKYSKAGLTPLVVSSSKTVLSSNGRGGLKGKGLLIQNARNVIIRDIFISDINEQVIWGGDALGFAKVQDVWIHNVTFARIGRQHLASFQQSNTGITVSSCFFDGTTKHSATCDGSHYWMWIFWGTRDEITLINNRVYNTAARVPHAGGWQQAQIYLHLVGNFMDYNPHTGIELHIGSNILAEGNIFRKYRKMINPKASGGKLALINTAAQAADCKKYFGQDCKVNKYINTKALTRLDAVVLSAFSKLDQRAITGARTAICL